MIGCVTQEAVDASNAAAVKAAPVAAPAVPGVPSAAAGVAAHADNGLVDRAPGARRRPERDGRSGQASETISAADFRRPYIAAGHAADSPGNPAGLAAQSAPIAQLAMTAVGRRS
jgi:hypothetical protein